MDVLMVQEIRSHASRPPENIVLDILSAEHPAQGVRIPIRRYDLLISVFPVLPSSGSRVRCKFYIIPQPDGNVILSDAGEPYE